MASNSETRRRPEKFNLPLTHAIGHAGVPPTTGFVGPWARRAALTLGVHADAFLIKPWLYLQAAAWRLRGYKVRSRNTIAPLLGRSPRAYALWIARQETSAPVPRLRRLTGGPMILPVIDCRETSEGLNETLASIGASGRHHLPVTIGGPGIAGATRIGHPTELAELCDATGLWVCALTSGDRLAPGALDDYAAAAATTNARLIYADDDLLLHGERREPHFKPQWNPDLFEHHDYATGASIVFANREALNSAAEQGWPEQLVADASRLGEAPLHLAEVLHHRRRRPAPRRPAYPVDPETIRPLVSVIIPTRNHAELLRTCIDGLGRVACTPMEVIVVDNGSDDRETLAYLQELEGRFKVLRRPGAFNFSKLNNAAVAIATGDLLCFLNNDVEMVDEEWLSLLVRQSVRPEVGAVGARLLYPDGTVQHAGVFTGIGGGAGHGHRFQREDDLGYFDRARLPQQVSAVTAACLVVAREKFLAVGGFDEQDFPVAFNDVDLCLKLNARGWQSLYEPRATLIHHESKSRGNDRAKPNRVRFATELAALKRKWHTDTQPDPYHHPQLSRFSEQFLIAV